MFRKEFSRLYELRDIIKSETPDSPCLRNLDALLQHEAMKLAYHPIEDALEALDSVAWEFLRKEASDRTKWDAKRGQTQLIDILNQARAYSYLRKIDCSDIYFIPRSNKKGGKTPDLQGALGQIKVICEVKTINVSDNEALRRRGGRSRHNDPPLNLEKGFFKKIKSCLVIAKNQMEACAEGKEVMLIIYIILNFDNIWGDHKEEHFQDIDQYLCENIIHGIEIVFHNHLAQGDGKAITMKCATVINE